MGEATLDLSATALPVMNPFKLTLRPALPADIGAVMAIERSPDYALYVARSDEEGHRAMLSSPSHAYRVGEGESGAVEAFAVVRGVGDPHLDLYLKRIAVARPGLGVGTAFLSLVLDEVFGPLGAERFHLDCFADNFRAQRSYKKLGFTRDGVMRESLSGGGRDARRPRDDGDPEERVGRAPALTNPKRAFSRACNAINEIDFNSGAAPFDPALRPRNGVEGREATSQFVRGLDCPLAAHVPASRGRLSIRLLPPILDFNALTNPIISQAVQFCKAEYAYLSNSD